MNCGVGDYAFLLANALASDESNVVGVLTSILGNKDQGADRVQLFPVVKNWSLISIIQYIKILRDFKPNIVHIQYPTLGYGDKVLPWLLPFIGFLFCIKIVQTWHEIYHHRQFFRFIWMGVVPGGLIVVRSNYVKKLSRWLRWGLKNKEIRFIRNSSSIPCASLSAEDAKTLKERYIKGQKRLITFFGFIYPAKGVELLFDIADPLKDHIIICGVIPEMGEYQKLVYSRSNCIPWTGKVSMTGELPAEDVAKLLAVSDAVILPFKSGGGDWNTSIHAAQVQGTFVITTSNDVTGYDEPTNTYFAGINDVEEMKNALNQYCGKKSIHSKDIDAEWKSIAKVHFDLYKALINK